MIFLVFLTINPNSPSSPTRFLLLVHRRALRSLGGTRARLLGQRRLRGAILSNYGRVWCGPGAKVLGVCLSLRAACNDLQTHSEKRAVGLRTQGPPPRSLHCKPCAMTGPIVSAIGHVGAPTTSTLCQWLRRLRPRCAGYAARWVHAGIIGELP